jgi:methionine-rich copper-binding protein CopC
MPGRTPLQSSSPTAGAMLAVAPAEVDLMFSEPMNIKFTGVKVTGPGEIDVKTRDPMLMAHDRLLMATLDGTLGPGLYTVAWHALSADGQARYGKYTFVLNP